MKSPAKLRAIELLFEIGCEEIPAGMLPKAEEDLRPSATFPPGSPRTQSQTGVRWHGASRETSCVYLVGPLRTLPLFEVGRGRAAGQCTDARHQGSALGRRD